MINTSQSLRGQVNKVIEYLEDNLDTITFNRRLLNVWDNQLRDEIEKSLIAEQVSAEVREEMLERVPLVNLLRRIIDKLSRVYSSPPKRAIPKKRNQKYLDKLADGLEIDHVMSSANHMLNLHKGFALEPYLDGFGKPQIRVLSADEYLPYSDDLHNPLKATMVIKLLSVDGDQNDLWTQGHPHYNLAVYTDNEILILSTRGQVRDDLMRQYELSGENPLGRIPFVVVSRSIKGIVPRPDKDLLTTTILIPKMLGDLNRAVKYQANSLWVATDVVLPKELSIGPNRVVNLTSNEDKTGRFDAVTPKVEIVSTLNLIQSTIIMWLESKNLKPGSMGKASEQRASGLSKLIDEADASQDRIDQVRFFKKAERELWSLLGDMLKMWAQESSLDPELDSPVIGELDKVETAFSDQKVVQTFEDLLSRAERETKLGIMSPVRALQLLYPDVPDETLEEWLKDATSKGEQETPNPPTQATEELAAIIESSKPTEDPPETEPPEPKEGDDVEKLNGAQVTALVAVIQSVAEGRLPRQTGIEILINSFGLEPQTAEKIMGPVGDTFTTRDGD